ncbi:MAG: hypothetical protein K2I71_05935 [Helicobacter sp.]|nr:hypothetical protein [Helicobacter sp.]
MANKVFSLPNDLYNKESMFVGNTINRRIRTIKGDKIIPLEVLPYVEKQEKALSEEICSLGFKIKESFSTNTQSFGNSSLIVFIKN